MILIKLGGSIITNKEKPLTSNKNSMVELNNIILESFSESGLMPYCLPPSDFMIGNKPLTKKIKEIPKIAKTGLIPISYGDVMWYGKNKFYILSGDRIMGILSKILHPRLAIFVTNVDGVYADMKSKRLLNEITKEKPVTSEVSMDVTDRKSTRLNSSHHSISYAVF